METKGALQSKTLQGIALITAVVTAFLEYGPQIQAMVPAPWDTRLGLALALVGAAWAAYGRYTATTEVKGILPK